MRLIFARTRYDYKPYADFWRLVELAGFEICYVDQIDYRTAATYVVTPINGEFRPHIQNQRNAHSKHCKVVWWNLERPDSGPGALDQLVGQMVCNTVHDMLEWVDEIWNSCRYSVAMAPHPRHKYVLMGSHPDLADLKLPRLSPMMYGWAHMSYESARRIPLYSRISQLAQVAPTGWGKDRSIALAASQLLLNVHQTDSKIGEPLRFAIAAAHAIPLLSETLGDSYPLQLGYDVLMAPYGDLPNLVREALISPSLEAMGGSLARRLCEEWTFRRGVEEAMK